MNEMDPKVDKYLIDGCMRCELGGTPDCKVLNWTTELEMLRAIVLDCGLKEEVKWGVPCYTHEGKNVVLLSALKDSANLSFLKGSLLKDQENLLEKPGKNAQAARYLKYTHPKDIEKTEKEIRELIKEAIEVEKAGLKVEFKKNPEPVPEELEAIFEEDPVLKSSFEALTPGRQRGYILFFSAPKQSKTRTARIERSKEKILRGEGLHDGYGKH